jgi:hypothetical protein
MTRESFIMVTGNNYFSTVDSNIVSISIDGVCRDIYKVIKSMLDYFDLEYKTRINFFHTNFVNPVDPMKYENELKQKLIAEIAFKFRYKYVEIVRRDWCYCKYNCEDEWLDKVSNMITKTIIDYSQ